MTVDERLEALTHSLELLTHSHAKTENVLRRAIAAGVLEARRQRRRSRELDEKISHADDKITQLASAQIVTEELLQAFLKRGGNGQHPPQ
jgi:hypothetical protein